MRVRERSGGVVAGAIICLIIAGCAQGAQDGTAEPDQAAAGSATAAEKDRSRWALPLDQYWVDDILGTAAEGVLVEECMRDDGLDYRRPQIDVSVGSETETLGGRQVFDVETAARWGYGGAPDPNAQILRAASEEAKSWSSEQDEQFWACLDDARDVLPTEGMRINNAVSGFTVAHWTSVVGDPAVLAAAERWVTCMQPLGLSDLPSSPHGDGGGMPTVSMSASYGEIVDGRSNEQNPEQEAEEIRLATFDAECRESSGYAQALYDAEWNSQMTVVAENEDALAVLLAEKAAHEEQAREILDGAGTG